MRLLRISPPGLQYNARNRVRTARTVSSRQRSVLRNKAVEAANPAASQARSLTLITLPDARSCSSLPTLTTDVTALAPMSDPVRPIPVVRRPLNETLCTNAAMKKCFVLSDENHRSPPECSSATWVPPKWSVKSSIIPCIRRRSDRVSQSLSDRAPGRSTRARVRVTADDSPRESNCSRPTDAEVESQGFVHARVPRRARDRSTDRAAGSAEIS